MLCVAAQDKWNAIEPRPFRAISRNWAGCPLESRESILNCVYTTMAQTVWHVTEVLVEMQYRTDVMVSLE